MKIVEFVAILFTMSQAMDSREISQKVESFLVMYPNATLASTALRLGLSAPEIEQALRETEGTSFQDFRQNWKLRVAFNQLGAERAVPAGPWEKARSQPRRIIPRTTVRFRLRSFLFRGKYSNPCPLIDLSSGGLGLLADDAPAPGKRVLLLLKCPEKEKEIPAEGRIVYKVATGIAGFRYRVGVQFLQKIEI